jgi:hypothetical protein
MLKEGASNILAYTSANTELMKWMLEIKMYALFQLNICLYSSVNAPKIILSYGVLLHVTQRNLLYKTIITMKVCCTNNL